MAVTLNAAGSGNAHATDTSPIDFTGLTVAAGSNTAILAVFSIFHTVAPTIGSVVWDPAGANQALTLITSHNNGNERVYVYGRVGAIATGNKTLRVTVSSAAPAEVFLSAIAFDGVDQTGGATSFVAATPATGTSNSAALTITSTAGNMTLAAVTAPEVNTTYNQTELYFDDVTGVATAGGAGYANGAASVTHTWGLNTSVGWVTAGVNIVAASGGGITAAQEAGIFSGALNSSNVIGRVDA